MKADPAMQRRLLDLQAVDTATAQRSYRRRTLPEIAQIGEGEARLAALGDDAVRAKTEISDLDREQRRLELDVEQVRARGVRDEQRLTSGAFSNPKELERLQHEVASLSRRQGDLEDQVLEVMERRESADKVLEDVAATAQQVRADYDAAVLRRDAAFAEIDTGLADAQAERELMVAELPADLVAAYERSRGSGSGTGAAALRQQRCEGCRMELASSSLSRARSAPADEVLRCEECGRILVRIAESGL